MQDLKTWTLISHHLAATESLQEKEAFTEWVNESEKNKAYFLKVKSIWEQSETGDTTSTNNTYRYRDKFTLPRIKAFIIDQALGNLVGFVIGMWVVSSFSHRVLERRSFKNLFGLAGRKQIVVNDIPLWLQHIISILAGFIVLEVINHFFKAKKYLLIWNYLKRTFNS